MIDLQSLQEDLVKQGLYGVVPLPAGKVKFVGEYSQLYSNYSQYMFTIVMYFQTSNWWHF